MTDEQLQAKIEQRTATGSIQLIKFTNMNIYEDPDLYEQLSHDRWLCFSIDSSWDRRNDSIELFEKTYLTQMSKGHIINLSPPEVGPIGPLK